jgi:hypothetical protein
MAGDAAVLLGWDDDLLTVFQMYVLVEKHWQLMIRMPRDQV